MLAGSQLPPVIVVSILVVFIIIALGCVMDLFTIMIVTAPLARSILTNIGYDLNWWGVMMVVLVELGVVTPPFGMNLFMMKSSIRPCRSGRSLRGRCLSLWQTLSRSSC